MRVARGEVRRLIICVPPRSMKSITVSVAFTAWVLGQDPTQAHHLRLLCRRSRPQACRSTRGSCWTAPGTSSSFPSCSLTSKRPRGSELITTQQGYRLALGMGGSILGRGADLIVVDDPIKATDVVSAAERRRVNEAFDSTLYTRLNDKKTGAIVIIMQRLHQDDLVGHVLDKGDWEVVSHPGHRHRGPRPISSATTRRCLSPPRRRNPARGREGRAELEATRRMQGSLVFSAQYQQAPVPPEGNIVRREWLRCYATPPDAFDFIVASWDTASTSRTRPTIQWERCGAPRASTSICSTWCGGASRCRTCASRSSRLAQRYSVDQTIVEDTELGRAIAQDLRRAGQTKCVLQPPRLDKQARFLAQSARFEAGQVFVPQDAPWLADWMRELLAFPNGRHDDQVDSTSQALHYLAQHSFARQQITRHACARRAVHARRASRARSGTGRVCAIPCASSKTIASPDQARRHARRASGEAKGRIIAFPLHCHRVRQPLRVT